MLFSHKSLMESEEVLVVHERKNSLEIRKFEVKSTFKSKNKFMYATSSGFQMQKVSETENTTHLLKDFGKDFSRLNDVFENKNEVIKTEKILTYGVENRSFRIKEIQECWLACVKIKPSTEKKYVYLPEMLKHINIVSFIGMGVKVNISDNKENKDKSNVFIAEEFDKEIKVQMPIVRNFSMKNRRHQKAKENSNLFLNKLVKYSSKKMLLNVLQHMNSLENPKPILSTKNSVGQKDYNLPRSIPVKREKQLVKMKRKIVEEKRSRYQESLTCFFPYRFKCYLVPDENLLDTILERQSKLKTPSMIHSRILVRMNDFLINEEDKRYCQIFIESITKCYLLFTLDLVDSVFPDWDIWNNGGLDQKCFDF